MPVKKSFFSEKIAINYLILIVNRLCLMTQNVFLSKATTNPAVDVIASMRFGAGLSQSSFNPRLVT